MYRGGILWTCIELSPGDCVPWRYSVDMHWVGTVYHGGILWTCIGLRPGTVYHGGIPWTCIGLRPGDRVPWRYSVDMYTFVQSKHKRQNVSLSTVFG